jgi:hypothetical protein
MATNFLTNKSIGSIILGNNGSNNNQPQMAYTQVGVGSTTNYGTIGFGTVTPATTLCWTAGGNVGIGTTAPSTTLQVNKSSNPSVLVGSSSSTGIELGYVTSTGGFSTNTAAGDGVLRILGGNLYLQSGGINTQIVCNTNGNVGIGTNSPNAQLQLYTTSSSSTRVNCFNIYSKQPGIILDSTQNAGGTTWNMFSNISTDDKLTFYNGTAGYVLTMQTNGNVGIGTNAPTYTLDVNGNIRASGVIVYSNFRGSDTLGSTAGSLDKIMQIGARSSSLYGALSVYGYRASNGSDWTSSRMMIRYEVDGSLMNYILIGQTDFYWSGTLSATTKTFNIQHPLHPNDTKKHLMHGCIEGPRFDLIYRGKKQLINGTITIDIDLESTETSDCAMTPGTFVALTMNTQVFVTNNSSFDRVIASINGSIVTITCENPTSSDIINWMVIGERKDMHSVNSTHTNENGSLITEYTE